MKKLILSLALTTLAFSSYGLKNSEMALAAPAQRSQIAVTAPVQIQGKTTPEQDARLILDRVKIARAWIQQHDSPEAMRQVRDALQTMRQMKTKLTLPLEEMIYSARSGKLLDAKGTVLQNLVPIERAIDEMAAYVKPHPQAIAHLNKMKSHLTQAREHLKAKNETAAKTSLKLADIELAQFEVDLPVTFTEAKLHQAFGALGNQQPGLADQLLQEIQNNLIERSAISLLRPAQS